MDYDALVKKAQDLETQAVKISTPSHGFVNHEDAGEAWGNAAEAWSAAEDAAPEGRDPWSHINPRHSWEACTQQAKIHFAHCP